MRVGENRIVMAGDMRIYTLTGGGVIHLKMPGMLLTILRQSYFDSTNRIVLFVQNGNNEIILKTGDQVVEKLVDVLADRNRKKQRNNTVLSMGQILREEGKFQSE